MIPPCNRRLSKSPGSQWLWLGSSEYRHQRRKDARTVRDLRYTKLRFLIEGFALSPVAPVATGERCDTRSHQPTSIRIGPFHFRIGVTTLLNSFFYQHLSFSFFFGTNFGHWLGRCPTHILPAALPARLYSHPL